jgi:ribonucleotide monophosphatase NagD (HAD superfamily)
MGKPASIIYEEAERLLGLQPQQIVAIGDSLEHDIAGQWSLQIVA